MEDIKAVETEGGAPPAKKGSPRANAQYPYFNLVDSLDVARKIHENAGGAASPDQLASYLNYKSTNSGTFQTRLSAAKQFGFVRNQDATGGRVNPNVILFFCILLGSCGGGGEQRQAVPCAQTAPVRIQLFGDSTMAGWDGATRLYAQRSPAVELQATLDAKFGRGATVVTSRAMSGTTAKQLVAGTDGANLPWPGSVDADIVVVNHGINDATHGDDLTVYRAALAAITANRGGAALVFETPNQVQGVDLAPFAQAMRDAARGIGAPVADTFALPASMILLGDWAHPSQAGYVNIVRESLVPAVVPMVEQVRRCGL